ncbi:unnamed protein product [Rotaria sp. Silwood1]|nr:unnamed protein product [Rotaria sp. Silwood1]CAF3366399.1 unnamed protein product [Rotaria sp. Silwood1]CAF4773733.1 unnamed protein product [Rotaria sp. Silwood1]
MSGIINALFGHHKDKDDKKHNEKNEATNAIPDSTSNSSIVHTAISDDVHVQSVVSTETNSNVNIKNSKKIIDLMNKLGTTHNQIDEYSKKRTAEISEAVSSAIEKVVADTATQQQKLLSDAKERANTIEDEYKQRLQERLAQLDADKAILLAELERSLNERQETILVKARQDIDLIQNAANEKKMAVFKEAQVRANQQVDQITEKVAELVAEDAQRRLQSTTQTIITTKSIATGENHQSSANHASNATTTTSKTSESH